MRKTKVLISVPNQGWIHKCVAFALLKLGQDRRYQCEVIMPTHNPYEHNLNRIVKDFVAGDWDYWLNIDADNPPLSNPLDLISLNLDVVGCPTPQVHITGLKGENPYYLVAVDKSGDDYVQHRPMTGLQEVDAIGSGCMLISRKVVEGMSQPFMRVYDEAGLVIKGADFNFCDRVKARGFRVFAHYDYICQHFKEVEMVEIIKAFAEVKNG